MNLCERGRHSTQPRPLDRDRGRPNTGDRIVQAAGQKLVPLRRSAVQRVLYELGDEMERSAKAGRNTDVEDMHAFSPTIDARPMLHERQRTRLYISW